MNTISFLRKKGILLCLLFFSTGIYAQNKEAYNWYFGSHVGMTWNTTQTLTANGVDANGATVTGVALAGLPTPLPPSSMAQQEGVFGMSDANGNLLFYSDGMNVWNKNHAFMPNGSGLAGHNSSAQSGIVIPYPGEPSKYIALAISLNYDSPTPNSGNRLTYSIIDMTLDGGFGDIVNTQKNVDLTGALGTLGESVAAVRHSNGLDYWIVAPGKGVLPNSTMNVWKVTRAGVTAALHASYPLPQNTNADATANGYLRFSADGKYWAWAEHNSNNLFFGEFNPTDGSFSAIKVMDLGYKGYGVEFSPSSKILYTPDIAYGAQLHAYKFADLLASPDPASVPHKIINTGASERVYPLQLGPDRRIYGTVFATRDMVVIDNVNDYDNFSVFVVNGLLTSGSDRARLGLPNYMAHFFAPVDNTCSYFTDDIWYFGTGGGGIAFNTNSGGEKVAVSASGESLVDVTENALSVSSPGCGSSLIFYSQHDRLYNAKHEVMQAGAFTGHRSVADGLAACYIGDNKYMLFSVTHAYEESVAAQLQYHIIDMNEDGGYGKRIDTKTLEDTDMSESVELIPVPGTSDQYWLVYNMLSPINELKDNSKYNMPAMA